MRLFNGLAGSSKRILREYPSEQLSKPSYAEPIVFEVSTRSAGGVFVQVPEGLQIVPTEAFLL